MLSQEGVPRSFLRRVQNFNVLYVLGLALNYKRYHLDIVMFINVCGLIYIYIYI